MVGIRGRVDNDYAINIRIPIDLAEAAKYRAKLEDRSLSSLIRRAIAEYVDREPAAA